MEPQGRVSPHGQPGQKVAYGQVIRGPLAPHSRVRLTLPLIGLLILYLVGALVAIVFALVQWLILATLLVSAWPLAIPILGSEVIGGWLLVRQYMRSASTTHREQQPPKVPATSNHISLISLFQLLAVVRAQIIRAGLTSWGFIRGWVERRKQESQQRQAAKMAAWQAWQAQQIAQQKAAQEAAARARQDEIRRLKTLNGLLSLSPTQFEHAVGAMLVANGYSHVRHTGGAGDLAADLTCFDSNGNRIVVQCKRYAINHLVGSPEVQTFIGMANVHHQATRGLFVTTSDFTQPARKLGDSHKEFIVLIDGKHLTNMMQKLS